MIWVNTLFDMVIGSFLGWMICRVFNDHRDYNRGYRNGQEIGRMEGQMAMFASQMRSKEKDGDGSK